MCAISAKAQQQKKPNILVIFGYDIGWFNVSAYNMGTMGYRTPNIDRIAPEGMMYKAGTYDMEQVLQLQTAQLSVESDVIKVRNARIANRINLHLALGGSFEAASAVR